MKTFIIFFIILFNLSVAILQAQNTPKLLDMSNKIPISGTQVTLSDVQKVGNTLWKSCSGSAVILSSTDGGNTFTSAVTASITQVIFTFFDATNGRAVEIAKGNKTTDAGLNWSPASLGLVSGMFIMDITTLGDYLFVATHSGGYVQHTNSSCFRLITGGMPMGGYMSNTVAVNNEFIVYGTIYEGLWYAGSAVITSAVIKDNPEFFLYPYPVKAKYAVSVADGRGKPVKSGLQIWL
jgi:hypothetical protein